MSGPRHIREFRRAGLALVLACLAAASHATPPKAELQELRQRIESLKKELDSAEDAKADATDSLRQSEQAISQISGALHELEIRQQQASADLSRLQGETKTLRHRIGVQQTALARLLYRQYLRGRQDQLKILLNQQDPNQASRQLRYFSYLSRQRSELLNGLRQNLQQAQQLAKLAQIKNDELARIKAEQDTQKRRLLSQQEARKKLVLQLSQKISQQRKQIGQLQRDEKRLTRLVERLAKILPKKPVPPRTPAPGAAPPAASANSAFQRLKGKLQLPVRGELVGRFGSPRQDTGIPWRGLFIKSPPGQAVKAVAGGRVVFADWLRGFGNLMIVDHGEGFMSLYGNAESLYKHVGEEIRGGDVIAMAGNSGGNPETGLYFEMRYQSKPFDPLTWFIPN